MKILIPIGAAVAVAASVGFQPMPMDGAVGEGAFHWEVTGTYVHACGCDVSCPAGVGVVPEGACDLTSVFQIEYGIYDGVSLDNLTVIVVTNEAFVRFYLDDGTSASQRTGLEEVARMLLETLLTEGFTLPEDQEVRVSSIDVQASKEAVSVVIPEILELRVRSVVGADGTGPVKITNLDLGPTWITDLWLAESDVYLYCDNAVWDHGGGSALMGRFDIMGMLR